MTTLARRLHAKEQKRRRMRIAKKIFLAGVALIIAIVGVALFLFSERFNIASVTVIGSKLVPETDIRAYVDEWLLQKRFVLLSERSYWLLNDDALATGLEASFSQIRRASVKKSFPSTLSVVVEEYNGWGVLCRGDPEECFWIDAAGIAFERAPGFSGLIVPKVRDERAMEAGLGERGLSDKLVRLVGYFNGRAVSDTDLQSVEFILEAEDATVRIKTRAGWEIVLSEDSDPERAYKNLRTAIDGDIKGRINDLLYIDLRFGNRIFYKFKS